MIYRKPYAFLIKYFKLIHILLFGLATFVTYKTYNLIQFFNEYIENHYSGNYYQGFANNYISPFVYFIIFLILICLVSIYFLLKHKNKPIKVYISSIGFYIIFLIYIIYLKKIMVTLETAVITAEMSRLYRDLSITTIVPQIYLVIIFIIRGLGFNIHKFNFENDLKELEITESDNEEVEFVLKKSDGKLKRNINRFVREFKYYLKENRFIFILIVAVLSMFVVFFIYNSLPEIIDKEYNQGENFSINNVIYKIEDSILTNLDYQGNKIDENYYLVIKMYIENPLTESVKIDYNNFRVKINNDYLYPIKDMGKFFVDYASDTFSNSIKANSTGTYLLIYKIKEEDIKKNYEIKIYNGNRMANDLIVGSHNYINITPIIINKINETIKVNIGEELNFVDSNLGNTKITLSNPVISNQYIYKYEQCVNNVCNIYQDIINLDYKKNNSTLMILDYKYEIDNKIPFYGVSQKANKFIETFMKIKYKENNEIVYAKVYDVTPNKLDGKIAIETTNKIKNSDLLELSFIIRNKEYIIKVK